MESDSQYKTRLHWLAKMKLTLVVVSSLVLASMPAANSASATCRGLPVTINMQTNGGNGTGTAGNDVILGTAGADNISGGDGIDTICAGGGNDTIYGGGGSDRIRGEGGNDTIYAGSGADDVWGGGGDDTIFGQGGQDDLFGQSGNDYLQGNHQSDDLDGGDGDDFLAGADGQDELDGGAGSDDLNGGNNSDDLHGGAGNDTLNGQAGADTGDGGSGSDTCLNIETETNCGPTAPTWTTSSQSRIESVDDYDVTLSWCCSSGATSYDVTIRVDGSIHTTRAGVVGNNATIGGLGNSYPTFRNASSIKIEVKPYNGGISGVTMSTFVIISET